MKNVKIRTRLMVTYYIIDAFILIIMIVGFLFTEKAIKAADPTSVLQQYNIINIVYIIVVGAFMTVAGVSNVRTIRVNLKKLGDTAEKLAAGESDVRVEDLGRNEFGVLANKFNEVAATMQAQTRVAQMVAEGNLTIDVETRSDADALNLALKDMVQKNKHALGGISEAAEQVNTAALEVSSAAEALAQGSTEQASAIEEITSSIDDVAVKTKKNAEEAGKAADTFVDATGHLKKNNELMKEMMEAMQDINESSENINKIIKVIDDIAFQTNILALNAAVEAARAGEAGKGFAVVAEEVRNLAGKSAAAASETAELIENSIHRIEKGSAIANETADALNRITALFTESESTIREIAESSEYQATAIEQIDQAVEQVSMVVQTNSATSQQCAAASIELSNQAGKMQELLSVYRLGDFRSNANTSTRPAYKPVTPAPMTPQTPPTPAQTQEYPDFSEDDITPTPTFAETAEPVSNAEDIISLDGDFGKY